MSHYIKNTITTDSRVGKLHIPIESAVVESNLPKLPWELWSEAVAFMQYASNELKGEAIVSFTIVEGEWVTICWNQELSGGFHVKYDPEWPENQALTAGAIHEALQQVHCTRWNVRLDLVLALVAVQGSARVLH